MEYYRKYRKESRDRLISLINGVIMQHGLKSRDFVLDMLVARVERIISLYDKKEEESATIFDFKSAAEHRAYKNAVEEFVCGFFDELVRACDNSPSVAEKNKKGVIGRKKNG
jgi:hypothetical protein